MGQNVIAAVEQSIREELVQQSGAQPDVTDAPAADASPRFVKISRRAFLLSAGGVSVGIAFGVSPFGARRVEAQGAGAEAFEPNAWVRIARNGTATIVSPASEMGQGTLTSMPLLLAEEMDLDWSRCRPVQASYRPKDYGNPRFGGGMTTGASRTTQGYYEIIRLAGLQARQVMIINAANKWGVPASECSTQPHRVVHGPSRRSMSYGEIAAFATVPADLPKFDKGALKPMKEFRLIGKDVMRVDVPDKSTGRLKYGIDTVMPNMLHGAVLRPPVQGEKPETVDDSAARAVPGVRQIVRLPYGVGVLADNTWAAQQGKRALRVGWTNTSPARKYDSAKAMEEFLVRARNLDDGGVAMANEGDAKGAISGAARTFTAEYASEHCYHACLEPMNATAVVTGEKIEIWAPSQSPFFIMGGLTRVAGFKPENITAHIQQIGGGYGRRVEADYILDAAFLARAADGRPVKVTWSREDDVANDKFRPLVAQHLSAGVDASGKIVGLRHRMVAESIYARAAPPLFQQAGGKDLPATEGFETKYDIHNHLAEYLREQRNVDVGFWRAVGGGYTKFAMEAFIDEIAAATNKDPLALRLELLAKQPRGRAVLEEAARMAGWTPGNARRGDRALGIAYSDMWNSHMGAVVEVSVDRRTGKVRVHEVWAACDCGHAVQPLNVARQIEGGVAWGVSSALLERLTIKDGVVQQSNFNDYLVLRGDEMPRVNVKVIPTDNYPGGVGEIGVTPIPPAIANAIAVLTGKRMRRLPFETAELRQA